MKEEDLLQIINDFQTRMISHEEILRALVLKVAGEHSLSSETRFQWIQELQGDIRNTRMVLLDKKKDDPSYIDMDRDVSKFTDRFFKPFR